MTKAYLVSTYDSTWDATTNIGVFLDKEVCEAYISLMNINYDKEHAQYSKCYTCRNDNNGIEGVFGYRDSCDIACIKTDRHGGYCENAIDGIHGIKSDKYYIEEVSMLG